MTRQASDRDLLVAVVLTFARRHRPVWSAERRRLACRCGADLPCRIRQVLLDRGDTPGQRQLLTMLTHHTRTDDGFCLKCRMRSRPIDYPCSPVRLAVHTFTTELAGRILDGLR